MGEFRVPFSVLILFAGVLEILDVLARVGRESDAAARDGGSGAFESAAVTDADGARMLTFFDLGFLGVLCVWVSMLLNTPKEGRRGMSIGAAF